MICANTNQTKHTPGGAEGQAAHSPTRREGDIPPLTRPGTSIYTCPLTYRLAILYTTVPFDQCCGSGSESRQKTHIFKGNNKILKISENHEKFAEEVDFYSSISLAGSVFRIRIRIQPGDFNPDLGPQHCL